MTTTRSSTATMTPRTWSNSTTTSTAWRRRGRVRHRPTSSPVNPSPTCSSRSCAAILVPCSVSCVWVILFVLVSWKRSFLFICALFSLLSRVAKLVGSKLLLTCWLNQWNYCYIWSVAQLVLQWLDRMMAWPYCYHCNYLGLIDVIVPVI